MSRIGSAFVILALFVPALAADMPVTPESIEDHFKLYVLNEDRRSQHDKTVITGDAKTGMTAVMSYWRSLQSRDPAEELCNAFQWILLGRGVYGKGAAEAFEKFSTLQKIYLRFVDVEPGTKTTAKRAEILPTQRVIPYLRVGVERKSLIKKNVDWSKVKDEMKKGKCADLGNALLDEKWFDKDFIAKGR